MQTSRTGLGCRQPEVGRPILCVRNVLANLREGGGGSRGTSLGKQCFANDGQADVAIVVAGPLPVFACGSRCGSGLRHSHHAGRVHKWPANQQQRFLPVFGVAWSPVSLVARHHNLGTFDVEAGLSVTGSRMPQVLEVCIRTCKSDNCPIAFYKCKCPT